MIFFAPSRKVKCGREAHLSFQTEDVIGHPFGLTYEISREGKLRRLSREEVASEQTEERVLEEGTASNQFLEVNHADAQDLTQAEIESLRTTVEGEGMVQKLKEGNASFKEKTVYSQQKYLRNKREKYIPFSAIKALTLCPIGSTCIFQACARARCRPARSSPTIFLAPTYFPTSQ